MFWDPTMGLPNFGNDWFTETIKAYLTVNSASVEPHYKLKVRFRISIASVFLTHNYDIYFVFSVLFSHVKI